MSDRGWQRKEATYFYKKEEEKAPSTTSTDRRKKALLFTFLKNIEQHKPFVNSEDMITGLNKLTEDTNLTVHYPASQPAAGLPIHRCQSGGRYSSDQVVLKPAPEVQ